jgi:hypothetical protein
MSPACRACTSAVGVIFLLLQAAPLHAQRAFGPATILDFAFDPLERSPRLRGMGGLTYTVEDQHNQIQLWDFARNPVGLLTDSDSSSLDFWSSMHSGSRYREEAQEVTRQSLSSRDLLWRAEAWRRSPGRLFYGAVASFNQLRRDLPYGETIYNRDELSSPAASGALGGRVKWVESGRMRWALRATAYQQEQNVGYRLFRENASGVYLGGKEDQVDPPNTFDPDEAQVEGFGAGGGLAYEVAEWCDIALGADFMLEEILEGNIGKRHTAEYNMDRPMMVGQAALLGRWGKNVEWGADGRLFSTSADQDFVYSVSGGVSVPPVAGRGPRLEMDQHGSSLRARGLVRLPSGFRVGGGGTALYTRRHSTPSSAANSYNTFLNHIYVSEPDADSLALPDSLSNLLESIHAYTLGGGVSWEGLGRLQVGAEYHMLRDKTDRDVAGVFVAGPYHESWEMRAGAEYRCNPRLVGRAGYRFRWEDADSKFPLNELTGQTLSLGAGYQSRESHWSLDAGWSLEWVKLDYQDPSNLRGGNQSLGVNLGWRF